MERPKSAPKRRIEGLALGCRIVKARAALEHSWQLSPAEARSVQRRLCEFIDVRPLDRRAQTVAGIDVSVKGGRARAAAVLWRLADLAPACASTAEVDVSFPYVPGLLAFREGPAVLEVVRKLAQQPDVLMFDAQGMAHPRRMGLASHLGVLLDLPSIGCAKSRLTGVHEEPAAAKGSWTPLRDGEVVIGAVVRTRDGVRPVFVSVGHLVDLSTAISLTLACCTRYRLPEPIRWAHRVAGGAELPAGLAIC